MTKMLTFLIIYLSRMRESRNTINITEKNEIENLKFIKIKKINVYMFIILIMI